MQGRHPLLIRASDPPVRLSRFEESLQTPGGIVQRDHGLAAPWDSEGKIALSGLEIGLGDGVPEERQSRRASMASRVRFSLQNRTFGTGPRNVSV